MRLIRIFVSYAHTDALHANLLRRHLEPLLKTANDMQLELWQDVNLLPGESWNLRIKEALNTSDAGLLLVSPSFLTSTYIQETELKHLLETGKVLLPIHLVRVCLDGRTDLKGLAPYQIFGLGYPLECRPFADSNRRDFAYAAFDKIYDRLIKELAVA